jgi:hypothetical protein
MNENARDELASNLIDVLTLLNRAKADDGITADQWRAMVTALGRFWAECEFVIDARSDDAFPRRTLTDMRRRHLRRIFEATSAVTTAAREVG